MRLMNWLAALVAPAALWCAPALAQKTSDLPTAATLTGTEQIAMSQGSGCATHVTPCASVKGTLSTIATFTAASLNAKLVAIAGLSPSANDCFYFTSSTAVATYSCSSFGRSFAGSADAAAGRTALGLGTLATQSGTFSGTSSGTNTGDQTSVSGNAGTATALAAGRTIAITGDMVYTSPSFDGSGNVTAAGTLATVNSNVGACGTVTAIPTVTLDGKGRATACTTTTLTATTLSSSWVPCKSAVAVSVNSTTTETTLATCTLPANAPGPNGQVEVWSLWSATNNANNKTPRVKFGGTAFYSTTITTAGGVESLRRFANRNATNLQVVGVATSTGVGNGAPTTMAIDTTASVDIIFTGQLANSGDTLTLESYMVRVTYGS